MAGVERRLAEAEAALASGFALLRLAETQSAAGARRDANRSVREAQAACAEGSRRLSGLTNGAARNCRSRLGELHVTTI